MLTQSLRQAILFVLATLLVACVPVAPIATQDEAPTIPTEYVNPEILVDTDWVLENLDDDAVTILDITNEEDFAAGHIPNAVFADIFVDFTNPNDSTRGQIITQDGLTDLMSRLGASNDDTIIVYDARSNLFAARAYWVLKYYQHADVRIYNGGLIKWQEDGQELTTETVVPEAADYAAGEADPEIRTTWEYVVEHTDDPSTLTCDTRSAEEYAGTDVRSDRGGHIPGAILLEWNNAVNSDGTFRTAQELGDLYVAAGFTPDKEIITYCQTGIRGAHTWFVLGELLGYPSVRNYDGSWEEWGNRADSPIEQ
ncbi:MAG: sulfurtransferase [Chloroflexota bacterium]